MLPEPRAELEQFLRVLWPDEFGAGWCLFWGAPSKRSEWTQAMTPDLLDQLAAWGEKENVYLGCALRGQNFGPTLRGERADCVAIPGLWLDIDYGKEHKKPNLPPTEEDAMSLIGSMGLAPSIVVHSGRGLQAWWRFREPWFFDTDEERMKAERMTKAWCSTLRARAKEKGWDADQVGDLPRVMRLPGLWNRKGIPKRTRLLVCDGGIAYNPEELEAYLSQDAGEYDATPNLKWTFTLNPLSEPPADKFAALLEVDPLFRASWLHHRTDFQDQSASSYDLALATRAFAADWTEQEIVNLLIAHRRKYKADPEKSARRDYFERTLNKAISGKDQESRKQAVEDLKAGKPLPAGMGKKDPAEAFAILSATFGATITKIVKYEGENGTYEMEINGRLMPIGIIEVLTSQNQFRNKLADIAGIWFPRQKPANWDQTVQMMLDLVVNVDVGKESTVKGALASMIDSFLAGGIATEDHFEQAMFENRPGIKGGVVYFPLYGLMKHIRGCYQEKVAIQILSKQMRSLGYCSRNIHVIDKKKKNRTTRVIWGEG